MQKSSDKSMNSSTPEYLCSLCGGAMDVIPDATGVKVRCNNPCLPTCHENVEGHGKNAKDAHEVACEKFRKSS